MVTDDDFKFNDEFEEGLEDLDNMSAEELAEWDKAATKIQSAHRGRKARTSQVPKQRRLRLRVDKNLVREVTAEEEEQARAEALEMVESGEWRYAKVQRVELAEGSQIWACSDATRESDAAVSQVTVEVEATKPDVKPPRPTYKTLKTVELRQHFDKNSARCGDLQAGETVSVWEAIDVDAPRKKKKAKKKQKIELRSGKKKPGKKKTKNLKIIFFLKIKLMLFLTLNNQQK